MVTRSQRGIVKPLECLSLHTLSVSPIPKSPFLALKDPNWCNAMYDALARLVANGSSQQLGVDFDETFSLVVKPATIRTVLSLAVSRQWPIHQLDVKNAFLNCDLSKTGSQVAYLLIYVDDIILTASSPVLLQQIGEVGREEKSGRRERKGRDGGVKGLGGGGEGAMVDEGGDTHGRPREEEARGSGVERSVKGEGIESAGAWGTGRVVGEEWRVAPGGEWGGHFNLYFGISVVRHPSGLFLSQKKYALQLLELAHMVNCNPSRTPVDTDSKLGPGGVHVQDPTLYRSLEGGFSILPDLAQICPMQFSRFGTLELGLHLYASATTSLVGYTDADWAGFPSTSRSTSSYCVFLGDNLLSWSVKRQHTISRSSAEAEYQGVANVVAETAWIRNLLLNQQSEFSQLDSGLTIPVFKHGDDPIDAISHEFQKLNPHRRSLLTMLLIKLKIWMHKDFDCDELNTAKVALMANLSHYGSHALTEVHNHDNVNNNMINQVVQVIPSSEQSNVATVQNSNSSAQQDALILSVIEQLKTQVANCTKINLENKSVNDTLTAELERYKEQVKVLNEGQNVDLKSNDNVSDSCAQSVEIDRLKQTLSEHLKEKESLIQTVSLLKDDFKKEESRNIDREIALEKRIKQLDNIVFKRDQSAQTVHMLTKPQFFYDHTTKQALGFQNPFYLKKAQQLEPKLYVGDIIEKTNPIVIPDSEETLLLAEESRSKMLLKQKDPIMLEKKVNTTPVDYANSVNSAEPTLSSRPTNVEVPKELPKVSMVNTSLKKLKHHLAGFDVVVKERTTPTAITEEVQNVFHQMEQAVEQHRLESKTFEVKMNQVLNENERLLEQVLSKDIVNIVVNSSVNNASVNVHECEKCLQLETELQTDFIEKEIYDKLFKIFTTLEKHCISLEVDSQLNQEIFQRDNHVSNQRKVFTNIGYIWRPTGRTFTIVGNACPLTRITITTEVPLRKPTALDNETFKPVITLVHSRKPRNTKLLFLLANLRSSKLFFEETPQPKSEDTNQEKLYLLHMDLCGPMRVTSVNGNKYILVIVNDYSRFTWVKFLRSKDEASYFIIKFLKMIQVWLKVPVRRIRTDNGTEFVNQTLRDIQEKVGNSHETSFRTRAKPSSFNTICTTLSTDWDILFQPLFDELITPPPSVDHPAPKVIALIAEVVALEPAASTGSPSTKTVDQDAPSPSNSQTTPETQPPIILNDVEEDNID
ncbi:retrovirus-related pol polyprotein from transposon TNT 1-94 [Tanacetum coccineum]